MFTAQHQSDSSRITEISRLLQHSPDFAVAWRLPGWIHCGHGCRVIQQRNKVFVDGIRADACTGKNQCQCKCGEAFENQTCGDGKFGGAASALRCLLSVLPEKQSSHRPWWKSPPEHMNGDD